MGPSGYRCRVGEKIFQAAALSIFLISSLPVSAPAEEGWVQAAGSREWEFPRDHGSHPEYRTEWWYFTGNLSGESGRRYGYQLTFFRQGIVLAASEPENPWSLRDLYLGHFAVTDVGAGNFTYSEKVSRSGPGLAGSAEGSMDVRLPGWSARMEGDVIFIRAEGDRMAVDLRLVPEKPPVFHGTGGLSRKGPHDGQSSWYVSYTDLAAEGTLTVGRDGEPVPVSGKSWFDHEFGSNQIAPDQAGWDWFSLHLSDGRDLMLYFMRRRDGTVEPSSSGTLVRADGTAVHIGLSGVTVDVLDRWKSGPTGGDYPARWRIRLPEHGLDLEVYPLVAGQELVTEASTGVTYWEGAVEGRGASDGDDITVEGYIEMTGYAGGLGGLF